MARRKSVALTDAELRIMRVLWDRERATVGEVVDGIATDLERAPALVVSPRAAAAAAKTA